MKTTLDTINERVSLRRYHTKAIPANELDIILDAAFKAPTAGNMMLYSIIRVTDQKLKDELAVSCDNQPFIATAPEVLIFCADWQKWEDYYTLCNVEKVAKKDNREVHHAAEGEFFLAANDAIIAAQNAVIAAESLNIGSCYIGDIMEHFEQHKAMLNLPKYVFPVVMLTFGYYPEDMKRVYRPRFNKEHIVFENQYQKLDNTQLETMFADRKYPQDLFDNFGQFMYSRKSGTEFIEEMSRSLKAALKSWSSQD